MSSSLTWNGEAFSDGARLRWPLDGHAVVLVNKGEEGAEPEEKPFEGEYANAEIEVKGPLNLCFKRGPRLCDMTISMPGETITIGQVGETIRAFYARELSEADWEEIGEEAAEGVRTYLDELGDARVLRHVFASEWSDVVFLVAPGT